MLHKQPCLTMPSRQRLLLHSVPLFLHLKNALETLERIFQALKTPNQVL